jgi:predicted transcriptional regulator
MIRNECIVYKFCPSDVKKYIEYQMIFLINHLIKLSSYQKISIEMLNPEIKQLIIEFLKEKYPKDFNIQEIADELDIHRNTVSTYVKVLVAENILKITRKMGRIRLYSYKKKNEHEE